MKIVFKEEAILVIKKGMLKKKQASFYLYFLLST